MKLTVAKFFYFSGSVLWLVDALIHLVAVLMGKSAFRSLISVRGSIPVLLVEMAVYVIWGYGEHQYRASFPEHKSPRWMTVLSIAVTVSFLVCFCLMMMKQ